MSNKLTEAEALRNVIEGIRVECDQEALAKAGGYIFRYVKEQREEIDKLRAALEAAGEALQQISTTYINRCGSTLAATAPSRSRLALAGYATEAMRACWTALGKEW